MFKYKVLGPNVLIRAQMKTVTKSGIVLPIDDRGVREILNKDKDGILVNETIICVGTEIKSVEIKEGLKVHTFKKELKSIPKEKMIEFGMDEKEITDDDRFYVASEDKILAIV